MFNETTFSDLGTIDCAAIKAGCLSQYPDDGSGANSPVNQALDQCLSSAGYYDSCGSFKSYDNPGATTYGIDVLTNTQNPNYILPNLGLGSLNTPALLIIAAIVAGFFFLRH
jgi:hypothetical protein